MAREKGRLRSFLSKHLSGKKLELAIQLCEEGLVDSVQDLRELYQSESLHEVFTQGMLRSKITSAFKEEDGSQPASSTDSVEETPAALGKKQGLPAGKRCSVFFLFQLSAYYSDSCLDHFFFSHKKQHSEWGELSESITVRIGDALDIQFGLKGFLDVDGGQLLFSNLASH
jgi:hypothetical protein